jgi:hypothetical protein
MKPDPLTAASVTTAWVVVANKPFYPLYVWGLAGSASALASLWTLAAWPLFAALPLLARRWPLAARAGLPLVGAADSVFAAVMFGEASGVEAFLAPCAALAALSFRSAEARVSWALTALVFLAFAALRYAAPAGVSPLPGGLVNLNLMSAASLIAFVGLRFASAR